MIRIVSIFIFALVITGCASSSDLEKSASMHAKAGDYYESIGQPHAAEEENNLATKKRKDARQVDSILVEILNLFSSKK